MRYSELMVGHLDRTALLNSLSCIFTLGSLLLRLASMMAAATAVSTTAPVPMTTELPRRAIAAAQCGLLLLMFCLARCGEQLTRAGVPPRKLLRLSWLFGSLALSMLQLAAFSYPSTTMW